MPLRPLPEDPRKNPKLWNSKMTYRAETAAHVKEEFPYKTRRIVGPGKGVDYKHALSAKKMFEAAGVDWNVYTQPHNSGMALIRETDQEQIAQVGDGYQPAQNRIAADIFQWFIDKEILRMAEAGCLNHPKGKMVWALAYATQGIEITGGDKTRRRLGLRYAGQNDETRRGLMFVNQHWEGGLIQFFLTTCRIMSSSQLTFFKPDDLGITPHITQFGTQRPFPSDKKDVEDTAQIVKKNFDHGWKEFQKVAKHLVSRRYTDLTLWEFFREALSAHREQGRQVKCPTCGRNTFLPDPNDPNDYITERARHIIESAPDCPYESGTWWQALNVIIYLFSELYRHRPHSIHFGRAQKLNVRALRIAMDMARAADQY